MLHNTCTGGSVLNTKTGDLQWICTVPFNVFNNIGQCEFLFPLSHLTSQTNCTLIKSFTCTHTHTEISK